MEKRKRKMACAVLAAWVLLVFSGCDEIMGFLGKDEKGGSTGEEDDPDEKNVTPPTVSGGTIRFVREDGLDYEVHVFTETGVLTFSDNRESFVADYFIVAGGGGAGGKVAGQGTDYAGGGGAGGLLYGTLQTLTLEDGSIQVTVGEGGAGGAVQSQGGDGGYSAIGNITVPGGGGGGVGGTNVGAALLIGKSGGSGGGGGAGVGGSYGKGGAVQSDMPDGTKGNVGGRGSNASSTDWGGGGGGAGGAGTAGEASSGGAGGAPWTLEENPAWAWLTSAIGNITEFSRGGRGGYPNAPAGGAAGVNYGDGGSGSSPTNATGGAGHNGIVVIRFLRISASADDSVVEEGEMEGS
jgi:hypothetical protein